MSDTLLNKVYSVCVEGLYSRPILEVINELYPNMSDREKAGIADYLKRVKDDIEDYFYYKYDHNNEANNSMLQKNGVGYFREKYPWISKENLIHTITRAMYYAWHG